MYKQKRNLFYHIKIIQRQEAHVKSPTKVDTKEYNT